MQSIRSHVLVALITAAITALVTSVLWVGVIALAYRHFVNDPPSFSVSIDVPQEVTMGEAFNLAVKISNPTDDVLRLGSIDIYDSLLDGFTVLHVNPKPRDRSEIWDFSTFYFSKSLAPGEAFTVTFELEALKAGAWTGDVDCCTPEEDFVTSSTTIVVKEKSTNPELR